MRAGQVLSSLVRASGSRALPDLCPRCTRDDLVPSLRVRASDKAIKQNWYCMFAPSPLACSLVLPVEVNPCSILHGKWCVWPPCVVRSLGVLDPDLGPAAADNEWWWWWGGSQSHFVVSVTLSLFTNVLQPHPQLASPSSLSPNRPLIGCSTSRLNTSLSPLCTPSLSLSCW